MIARWILIFVLALSACSRSGTVSKPPLSEEKTAAVLVDIHLLEASQQTVSIHEKGRIYNTVVGYENIFYKHGVTSRDFYDSYTYFRDRPQQMEALYDRVIDEVTRLENNIAPEAAKERMSRGIPVDTTKRQRRRGASQISEW